MGRKVYVNIRGWAVGEISFAPDFISCIQYPWNNLLKGLQNEDIELLRKHFGLVPFSSII